MAEWRRMLIGIGPLPPHPTPPSLPPLHPSIPNSTQPRNLLFMHHKQRAHVRLFPLHSLVATVDERKQPRRRRQTKQINENAQTAPRFKNVKEARMKGAALDPRRCTESD